MAINKITAPLSTGPNVFADPVINQLAALLTDCNHGARRSAQKILQGALFNIGGVMFKADSDTAITGTRYKQSVVKFTISGDVAIVEQSFKPSITWNGSQQGYYDTAGNYFYTNIDENVDDNDISAITTIEYTISVAGNYGISIYSSTSTSTTIYIYVNNVVTHTVPVSFGYTAVSVDSLSSGDVVKFTGPLTSAVYWAYNT